MNQSIGSVAVTAHYAVAERTVVHAYAYGRAMAAAQLEKRHKLFLDFLKADGKRLIAVVEFAESAGRIHEVARIYPHFLHMACGLESGAGIEMDIGHKRHIYAFPEQSPLYLGKIPRLTLALRRESDVFGACYHNSGWARSAPYP